MNKPVRRSHSDCIRSKQLVQLTTFNAQTEAGAFWENTAATRCLTVLTNQMK